MKHIGLRIERIPTKPILEFLLHREKEGKMWCCWFNGFENSIGPSFPEDTPEEIIMLKMARLIKQELVSGCGCGCRGDYEITQKGKDWLSNNTI